MRGVVATSIAAMLLLSTTGCERYALDRQMEELCKKDGGVKVYETVTLPASLYDRYGVLVFGPLMAMPDDAYFQRVGDDDYRMVTKKVYIVGKDSDPTKGEGNLVRVHTAIYRWKDKHLLGESIEYWRGGGDGVTFGFQPSSNVCPKPRAGIDQLVFSKGE